MHPVRIEAAGVVLKPSGQGWVAGSCQMREIKGSMSERVLDPSYTNKLSSALPLFVSKLMKALQKGGTRAKARELSAVLQAAVPAVATLDDPGPFIQAARQAAGFTQRELAHYSGVSRSAIQGIESGRTQDPKLSTVQHLIEACCWGG